MASMKEKNRRNRLREKMLGARRPSEILGGGSFTSLNLPGGVNLFQVKTDDAFSGDIVPYIIQTPGENPCAVDKDGEPLEKGDLFWVRVYFVHKNVGPDEKSYCCPAKNGWGPCPICEHAAAMRRDPGHDEETVRALWPQKRELYVWRPRTGERKGELTIFDTTTYCFGKYLDLKLRPPAHDEAPDYRLFWDPEDGYYLNITPIEKKLPRGKYYEFPSIEFVKRSKPLNVDLEQVPDLDAIPRRISYDELKDIFLQVPSVSTAGGEEGEEERPSRVGGRTSRNGAASDLDEDEEAPKARRRPAKDEEEDPTAEELGIESGSVVEYEGAEWTVVKISGDGTSITLEDEDGEQKRGVAPSEVELLEEGGEGEGEEEEDTTPPRKPSGKPSGKTSARKPAADEDEDEGEDEDLDEDLDEDEDEGEDEDLDEDDDLDEGEEEEEEARAPASGKRGQKPSGKPGKKPGRR